MILLADSGSTQCTWIADDGSRIRKLRTRGINAVQHTDEQIRDILSELPELGPVTAIHFYGAGAGDSFPEASQRLCGELRRRFAPRTITIDSDLTAAARALWGRGEGIACILGTGSNSGVARDGQIVRQVPPLGYILGDEGSGAALGRALLNGLFKGHIPLREEVLTERGLTYEEIIRRVYREGMANRFLASFTRFVARHIDRPELDELVCEAFRAFVRRNLAHYPADAEVSALGGVACHFERQLRHVLATEGLRAGRIVETPDEGLLNYHIWNRSE